MWRFFNKIANFMYGRHGWDKLNTALSVIYFIIAIVNMFIRNSKASMVLFAVQWIMFIYIVFRFMSKKNYARQKENDWFMKNFSWFDGWFDLTVKRIKDLGVKRYRKCPNCHSVARLPIRRGRHTVKCPVCNMEYKVFILL